MKRVLSLSLTLAVAVMLCSSCAMTRSATNFNGLSTPDGKPIAHLSTSHIALHLLMDKPLAGDASLEATVADFTRAAKDMKATKVDIVQSSVDSWWYLLPPFTIVLTPMTSNVAGNALP